MPQGFRCYGGLRLPDQVGARKFISRHEERRRRGEALREDTARPSHRGRRERGVCVEHGIPSPINNKIQFEPRINSSTYKYFAVVFLWSAYFWQLALSLNALLPSIEWSTATAPNRHLTRSSAAGAGGGHGSTAPPKGMAGPSGGWARRAKEGELSATASGSAADPS